MNKIRRDDKNSMIARVYAPIADNKKKCRIWCGDSAVDEFWNSQKKILRKEEPDHEQRRSNQESK